MPKRIKVYECNASMVYDLDNLLKAHNNAKRGKGFYSEVKDVDEHLGERILELSELEESGEYHTSEYDMFKKKEGKKVREIYKLPYYPDRIHQWAIIQVIEPFLLRTMTDDTYSAIPGRGIELARKRIVRALRNDVKGTLWCLKIDVSKYYYHIVRKTLKKQYARIFKDKELLKMIYEEIDSFKRSPDEVECEEEIDEVGVPIGNYMSQYSGNLYLTPFDHYVKEVLGIKHYFRYMDDMVMFAETKEELQTCLKTITVWLHDNLGLTVKRSWSLFFVEDRGVDFIGYVFRHRKVHLRKAIAKNLKKLYKRIVKRLSQGKRLTNKMYCGINSFYGWLKHSDSGGLYRKYYLSLKFYIDDYHNNVICRNKQKKEGALWLSFIEA